MQEIDDLKQILNTIKKDKLILENVKTLQEQNDRIEKIVSFINNLDDTIEKPYQKNEHNGERLVDAEAILVQAEHLISEDGYNFLKKWLDSQITAYDVNKTLNKVKIFCERNHFNKYETEKILNIINNNGEEKT